MTLSNKKPIIIGITGGIGTGKSTVSNMLIEMGYTVVDADKIARNVLDKGKIGYKKVVEVFGEQILFDDGSVNRKKLGSIIFNDQRQRELLNMIVHPCVHQEIKEQIKLNNMNEIVFLDIPLLIEGVDKLVEDGIVCDKIWLVYANKDIQITRLLMRDGFSEQEALSRINSQMPIEEKREKADIVIRNEGTVEELKENVIKELNEILL